MISLCGLIECRFVALPYSGSLVSFKSFPNNRANATPLEEHQSKPNNVTQGAKHLIKRVRMELKHES